MTRGAAAEIALRFFADTDQRARETAAGMILNPDTADIADLLLAIAAAFERASNQLRATAL